MGIEVGRLEGPARREVGEADERVHQRQLPRMIQLQPGEAFAGGQDGWGGELPEFTTVHEGLEDVLLDIEIGVDDAGEFLTIGLADRGVAAPWAD